MKIYRKGKFFESEFTKSGRVATVDIFITDRTQRSVMHTHQIVNFKHQISILRSYFLVETLDSRREIVSVLLGDCVYYHRRQK